MSLAKNIIGDEGAEKISEFLDHSGTSLKLLNLHWNNIKFKGGILLAQALKYNESLRVLDLSWNLLGKKSQILLG